MDAQMKKGVLEMCILFEISKQEMYGYEILKRMNQFFPQADPSTIYAILRRLNADEHTETYIGDITNGPQRKYYRITQSGKQYLKDSISDWNSLCSVVHEIGVPNNQI